MRKVVAFAFLALLGCGEREPVAVKVIDFEAVEGVSADLLIEKAILLETDTTALLSEYLMVKYDKDDFFVMNYDRPTGIHRFSKGGKYSGLVAEIGEAPGQVMGIRNFRLFGDVVQVNSGFGNSLEIHSFEKSGELLNSTPYPINAFSFYPVSEGEVWFYSSYNMVAGDHRLFIADGKGEVKKKLLPNDFNEGMLPFDEQSFFEGDDAVLFRESFKTSVYELSEGDSLREVYRFDFGATTVPEKYWEMDAFAGFDMITKQGFSNLNFLQETEKYLLADVVTQNESGQKKELYIWNKSTGKEFKIEIDEDEQRYFQSPIGIEGDQLVFIAYAPYLVRNSETLNLSVKAKASLASVTEESNPVILYATIPE
ncbi:6-bladed beta-propeller protein [Algoriphagus ratkowskyi]|uniref:6-bladed beta-propeller n=1 Tax=Algoriphagus ratkowskyi TaxID=57028 RepID=A0A2W7R921_9BACT|nr:6-bladed beta-propeller [Algoriphagus ratkowskyi]PZX50719.1 6-bladed beta-propeller protein [Algoriphagus ratkowskyi]TXD75792.1 6-bladed beta-propeller [Algoriphagus ratkowskyi]